MSRRAKMIILIIGIFILVSIISFILLIRFYLPLDSFLFSPREFLILPDDIQFWVEKVPGRNYYKVDARYKKSPIEESGGIHFDDKMGRGGWGIIFNPEDGRMYGQGVVHVDYDDKGNLINVEISMAHSREELRKITSLPTEWRFYCLGEGKIEAEAFKPIFPEGTKFTFCLPDRIGISSAPAYHITIHFPDTLKKLEKEELEKGVLAEIVEDVTRPRK